MTKRLRIILETVVLLVLSLCQVVTAAELDWQPEGAWKRNKKKPVFDYIKNAETLEQQRKFKDALKYYKKIEKYSINLSNKAKAIIAQGRCLNGMSSTWQAYERFQKAVDNYSTFIPFVEVLQLEYDIANTYYDGKRDRFLFFSFSNAGKAIEIYDHIAQAGPYAAFTPDVIYRSGILSLELENYEEAADKFRRVITKYPRSAVADDARIDLGYTLLIHSAEADGDGTLVRQARQALSTVVDRAPNHPRIKEAKKQLQTAMELEAERLLYLGEFYQRQFHRRDHASKRYFTEILTQYKNTESARRAEILLGAFD